MVRALQEALNKQGAALKVDGDFGKGTDAAVRAFQLSRGLSVDGVVGRNTIAALLQAPGTGQSQQPEQPQEQGPTEPGSYDNVAQERGALAVKGARQTYLRGRELHGAGNSWETQGANQGPIVNELKAANNAGGSNSYEWCGMFVGAHFKKAGIRDEIMKNLVFWSGLRLHNFFTNGSYVATRQPKAGSWWQPHKTTSLKGLTGARRKDALKDFAPQEGDIALFRNDYSHVAVVAGYDPETGDLELLEGNRGNRVQATTYGTADGQITFLGRFNDSDYEPNGSPDAQLVSSANPNVTHGDAAYGSTH
ncbi:MAG: peptidoglycan-binding protein [Alphaproteobacteria bacterium]|nr:peptidoglycan-binding protein [Alphaproteobacteria bacterium]